MSEQAMPPLAHRLRGRLSWCLVGSALALLFAFGAAHDYEAPNLAGLGGGSLLLQRDFLLALASGVLALGVGVAARPRWLARQARTASVIASVFIGFALSVALLAAWVESISLLTLLIAPTHAFATLRLVTLWRTWRTEVAWQRSR